MHLQTLKSGLILIAVFALSNSMFSQNKRTRVHSRDQPVKLKNEIKLNLAYAPFSYIETSYERMLPKKLSLGIAYGRSLRSESDFKYHIIAYCRLYFGRQSGQGFFIEANGVYWKEDYLVFGVPQGASNGIGFAFGGKFFRKPRFLGEFVIGIGKTITVNSYQFGDFYLRTGISIGHRF